MDTSLAGLMDSSGTKNEIFIKRKRRVDHQHCHLRPRWTMRCLATVARRLVYTGDRDIQSWTNSSGWVEECHAILVLMELCHGGVHVCFFYQLTAPWAATFQGFLYTYRYWARQSSVGAILLFCRQRDYWRGSEYSGAKLCFPNVFYNVKIPYKKGSM